MALRIGTNTAAMNAQRYLGDNSKNADKSSAQLASGKSIVRAADNAAGLSISAGLDSRVRGLGQARRNAVDALSVLQTAEGGLNEVSNILIRINELGVQAASDSTSDSGRSMINKEIQQLKNEVERISQTTRHGNVDLLNGSGFKFEFQVDTNTDSDGRIGFDTSDISARTGDIGIEGLDFSNKDNARNSLDGLLNSQKKVNGIRADLGALQNRFVASGDNLGVAITNLSESKSQISDVDIAASTAEKARSEIMMQSSVSMLAQANQSAGLAMKLL